MTTSPQQVWLAQVILAVAVASGKRNVKSLCALLSPEFQRTTMNDFMIESPWIAPEVLRAATLWVLAKMDLEPGELIEVIMDGSQKAKRGSHMEGLCWIKEAGMKTWQKGHRFLLCYLRVRGVMLPWAIDLYLSEKFLKSEAGKEFKAHHPEIGFRTLNEMSADVLKTLPVEWKGRYHVRFMLDSGFCNSTVCNAITEQDFEYVVAAQSTRVLVKSTEAGKKGKRVVLREYAPGRLRYQGQDIRLPAKRAGGGCRWFRVAEVTGKLKGLGQVKVVFSQRRSDGSILPLVTSDLALDAREVALAYGWRWEIEVAIKGLKQRLGLGQYQCRCYEGTVHHLHLTLLAHIALTAAEFARNGKNAWKKKKTHQLPSIRTLQNRLRNEMWQAILDELHAQNVNPEVIHRFERVLDAS